MFDETDLTVGPLAGEQFALPQREGPVDLGKAQEFAMSHVGIGDYGNIRTVEFVQPDGTIARLRTRGGYPVFETDAPTPVTSTARGFVAKVPAGRAVLFNPYTLTVLNSDYNPAGKHYTVQDFATTWGVPAGDTTHWHDVVLADGSVKINAKTYSPFGSFGTLSETAIPHIINRADDYDQYGNVELNLTQKRYFEIERESVKTWGGAGSVSLLTPQAPITDAIRRAMTVGPFVDFATDTAWLAEFYSSSVIWDDPGAMWLHSTAAVQMLLTSAYLVKTSRSSGVDMPIPALGDAESSSGSVYRSTTLPSTEIGLIGAGRINWALPYVIGGGSGNYTVVYDWTGTVSSALEGYIDGTYTRTQRQGSSSVTEVQAGVTLTYSGTNEKHWDSRHENTNVKSQTVNVAYHDVNGGSNYSGSDMTGDTDNLYWGQYYTYLNPPSGPLNTGDIASTRGRPTYQIVYNEYIAGSSVTRAYEEQYGTFRVSVDAIDLIRIDLAIEKSFGNKAVIYPYTGYYAGTLETPIYDGPEFGSYNGPVYFKAYSDPATDVTWITNYQLHWNGSAYVQDASAVDAINAKYIGMAERFAAMTLFDNENSQGVWNRDHYTAHVASNVTLDDRTVVWDTKDHILYDSKNGVFITVEGHFSGAQSYLVNGSATLTVTAKVETRYSTVVKTLETLTFSYGQILPEKDVLTGVRAFPSPQIRAIFAPLYREQGSFKGAHYVTQAEELAGATPFHGFNFRLRLVGYDAVGSVNTLNKAETVYLVPCNLLEMLYATVFSSEFGVADDGSRYPVTRPSSYNAVMNSLFTNAYRVAVRDGVAGNWTDVFGTDFAETSTISLHRT